MARAIRIEFKDAIYHVMARGNERKAIFRSDLDRKLFLATLEEAVERFGIRIPAYCLMVNHYHLVVVTPRGNLSRALGWLQTTYTIRFNHRHRRHGHLFQGRFKALLVEADEYARQLVEYIHLNPVRVKLRKGSVLPRERRVVLDEYKWSSHRLYAGLEKKAPEWFDLGWMGYYGRTQREAWREYRKTMDGCFGVVMPCLWKQVRKGLVLGGDELMERVKECMGKRTGQEELRWREDDLVERQKERVEEILKKETDSVIRMWMRVNFGGERMVDVGRDQGYVDGSGVAVALKRLRAKAAYNSALKQKMEKLKKVILSSV